MYPVEDASLGDFDWSKVKPQNKALMGVTSIETRDGPTSSSMEHTKLTHVLRYLCTIDVYESIIVVLAFAWLVWVILPYTRHPWIAGKIANLNQLPPTGC